ncbi:Protein of unknown function DUF3460 [Burkholderiaceae bacterium]|jgi:Protein of unknown function (DUF3460)
MKKYKSQATQFLEQLKAQNPHLEQAQREGRALLWDKAPQNPEEVKRTHLARIKQRSYVYSND